jgi:hypothetical protein
MSAHLQAATLTDRELIVAVVLTDDVSVDVDDLAGAFTASNPGLALDD